MSQVLSSAVFDPNSYFEVYHNGSNLIGLIKDDLLAASLAAAVTAAPRKSIRQILGTDKVVPAGFFGQHSTAAGIPAWSGKLLKIGGLLLGWQHLTPWGSLAVTFAGANVTWTAHGRTVGTPVTLFAPADATVSTAGVLPTGYTADAVLYITSVVDANTVQLSATPGGAAITFGGSPTNCGIMAWSATKLAALDAVIDAAVAASKDMIYQTHDTPAWAAVDGSSTNKRPKSYKPFATFFKALYNRVTTNGNAYAAVVKFVEGWNEPNTANSFSGTQYSAGGRAGVNFTANVGAIPVSWTAHAFPVGAVMQAEANGGTLPPELSEGVPYFVCRSNYSANQFALTSQWTDDGSGAPITFSNAGSGSWKLVSCDLTIHQAWISKAAKAASASIGVLSASYTGAQGQTGAAGQYLTLYRGARSNNTRYEAGECVYLTANDGRVHCYRISTAGTTAAAQATYAGTSAENITDGTAVLTECSISTNSLAGWLITNGAILGNFIEKIGFHPYQGPLDGFSFDWRAVDAVMMVRQAYGLSSRDVWCTEFGFASPQAASDLWRMVIYSAASGVSAFVYFDWDSGTGSTSGATSMRLVDAPAMAAAYNIIANTLAGATINFANVHSYSGQLGASVNGVPSLY